MLLDRSKEASLPSPPGLGLGLFVFWWGQALRSVCCSSRRMAGVSCRMGLSRSSSQTGDSIPPFIVSGRVMSLWAVRLGVHTNPKLTKRPSVWPAPACSKECHVRSSNAREAKQVHLEGPGFVEAQTRFLSRSLSDDPALGTQPTLPHKADLEPEGRCSTLRTCTQGVTSVDHLS